MFTGIVETMGRVKSCARRGADMRLTIDAPEFDFSDVAIGDSICVNGVCLSAVELGESWFSADVSAETLSCTTLGALGVGSSVDLEKALLPTTRIGGHLVSGHVDGVARIDAMRPVGDCRVMRITVPAALARYIAAKGSVCVDGVSLTVNSVEGATFEVNLIPHTLARTVLGQHRAGTAVNIEIDVVARYLERLLGGPGHEAGSGIDRSLLSAHGYIDDVSKA
ncbi:MAG: riboflavin synthase [Gammaproteobacteria bacterium]|jgi:riboflavin synthase|nr:riboflavin synthase [Gammaproteobacteria bacterium]